MPLNTCIECGGERWRFSKSKKGTCSTPCFRARMRRANKKSCLQKETERRLTMDRTEEPRRLLRDLDGFVHSSCGFLSAKRYEKMRSEHPDRNFPAHADIPLMSDLSDEDLDKWYGGNVPEIARQKK